MRASAFKFSQKLIGEGGVRVVAAVFILLLARKLGAEEFGKFSTAMAFAAICIVFIDMGTNSVITRELARRPEERTHIAKASHTIKIASGLFSWLLLFILSYVFGFSPEARFLTLMCGFAVMGQALTDYFSALLNGIEEMGWEAVLKVTARFASAGTGLTLLLLDKPLAVIAAGLALGALAGYLLSCLIIWKRFSSFGFSFDGPFIRALLTSAAPLFVSVLFWILYESQDILILNLFHLPQQEVGYFSAAVKILDVLRVYPVLLMGVFFPALSRFYFSDPALFIQKRKKLLLFLSVTLMGISVVIFAGAPAIIHLLYKADYTPAVPLLRVLACSLTLSGINYTLMQLLITTNRERELLKCALISCAVNVIIAVLLVPPFGPLGTCYALMASEIVNFFYLSRTSRV